MTNEDLLSKTINSLRFPLTIGVVFIHFSFSEGFNIHGVIYGKGNPDWFFFIVNLISEVFARICVPLFYIISGFLFFYQKTFDREIYKEKIRTRIKTLLLPFIIWNLIAIICIFSKSFLPGISNHFPHMTFTFSLERLLNTFICNANNNGVLVYPPNFPPPMYISPINVPLWYVRDLMGIIIITPIIYSFIRRGGIISIVILGITWLLSPLFLPRGSYLSMFIYALFFFSWGAFYSINKKNIVLSFRKKQFAPIVYIIIAFIDAQTKTTFYNIYINMFGILFGTVAVVSICSNLLEKGRFRVSQTLSNSCFFIFASHTLFMCDAGKAAFKVLQIPENNPFAMLSFYFAVPIITITICYTLYISLYHLSPNICKLLTGGR